MRVQARPSGLPASSCERTVAGDGAGEALEGARGGDGLLASEVLDDALFGAAALAHGLDEVEVGVAVDALLADEHAISSRMMLDFVK